MNGHRAKRMEKSHYSGKFDHYCILTIGLVIYFYSKLTTLGISYFVGEILILSALIHIEIKTLKVCNQRIHS
jgi:hypothetical protein